MCGYGGMMVCIFEGGFICVGDVVSVVLFVMVLVC